LVVTIIALWIGSAIAGWFFFWPWLALPIIVIGFFAARINAGFRAARIRNGLPVAGNLRAGTSMVPATLKLLFVTLAQHLAIFAVAGGVHWMLQ
jgi:hypothetical protein